MRLPPLPRHEHVHVSEDQEIGNHLANDQQLGASVEGVQSSAEVGPGDGECQRHKNQNERDSGHQHDTQNIPTVPGRIVRLGGDDFGGHGAGNGSRRAGKMLNALASGSVRVTFCLRFDRRWGRLIWECVHADSCRLASDFSLLAKRFNEEPLKYEASSWPVYDFFTRATCSGVPWATMRPPSSPPSGPRSRIQSALRITSMLCSMMITVLPRAVRRCNTSSSLRTSSKCSPVVGSSSRERVLPVWRLLSSRASFMRWASPPESVTAD